MSSTGRRIAGQVAKGTAAAVDVVHRAPRGVTVLIYHRVGGGSGLAVDLDPGRFEQQIAALSVSGRVVTLDGALDLLDRPDPPEQDPVVVTFDDGTEDFADVALPIMMRHGVPSTLYVATQFLDDRTPFPADGRPISWSALRDACATGLVTVGSHTHSHALLDRLPANDVRVELDRSVARIGEELGIRAEHFAYPKAVLGSAPAQAEVRARFRSAAIAGTRPNPFGATDPQMLARSPIQTTDGMRWFDHKVAGGMAFEDTLRRTANRWRYANRAQLAMPRLVHVTTSDISLALLLGPQLTAFARAGYEVIGVSAPGRYVPQIEAAGIEHRPLRHATRSIAPHRDAAALYELYHLFRELRPEIVHTHNPKPGVYGRMATRAARTPVVVNTVHGLYALPEDSRQKRALVYSLERVAAACSDAELVQNPEDLETLARIGVPRRKLTRLGNGIDLERFCPTRFDAEVRASVRAEMGAGPDDVVVGVVGRLVWEKGYREVFDAAGALAVAAPNVRIVVIGPAEPAKEDAVTDADLDRARSAGNITFLGERDDVERLYAGMDLYVLASYREGFPRSAMEAAAMGLPVITTDIRGCREVVDDGTTGLLVPVRDAGALGGAITALAADPDRRVAMSRAGRSKAAADFDQETVIELTLETYARLLAQRRGRTM